MSKYYIIGGLLCLGGLLLVCFQAISSLMNPGDIVWKSISLVDVVDAGHLKWIDGITWYSIHRALKYIISMPLYLLLLIVGGLSFVVGGLFDK